MSYSEDIVRNKLSTLNETQESIVGISQWVMFHKRYAKQIADIWAKHLQQTPPNKRLSLIYLANEVVQQSRAKRKDEFVNAFARVIAPALGTAYSQASKEVKERIKRVVGVWTQRQIFSPQILQDISKNLDSSAPSTVGSTSAMDLQTPAALKSVSAIQQKLDKTALQADKQFDSIVEEYTSVMESDALPAPPEYFAKLNQLYDKLKAASTATYNCIDLRKQLEKELQALMEDNKNQLSKLEGQHVELSTRTKHVGDTRAEVQQMVVSSEPPTESATELVSDTVAAKEEHEPQPISAGEELEYSPLDDNVVPEYSPLSSDEESEAPPKKQKTKNTEDVSGIDPVSATSQVEGLDPAVAQFLSSMANKQSGSNGSNGTD